MKCNNCGRELKDDDVERGEDCGKCSIGKFYKVGNKEENEEDEEEFSCDECEEDVRGSEIVEFNCANICKGCIDKFYPREKEVKIEYKEKIVEKPVLVDKEGNPRSYSINIENKTKFD